MSFTKTCISRLQRASRESSAEMCLPRPDPAINRLHWIDCQHLADSLASAVYLQSPLAVMMCIDNVVGTT